MKDKMNHLPFMGAGISVCAFVYLTYVLMRSASALNPASWVMWVVIDVYLTYVLFRANVVAKWIMLAFTTGASIIALITLVQLSTGKTHWSWSNKETLAVITFAIPLMIRMMISGNTSRAQVAAVVSATLAMNIAGIPTLIDAWNQPQSYDAIFWGASTVGCILTVVGSPRKFTDQFMPVIGTIFNGSIAALALGLIK